MKRFIILLATVCCSLAVEAQELNCNVTIISDQINAQQAAEKQVFVDMKIAISDFINNKRWTNDIYSQDERIKCNLIITFTKSPQQNVFQGNAQFQVIRPVFNTTYETLLLSYVDRVRFRIPDWVTLEGVYVPDLKKDTLLYGKRLHVDLDMLGLLSGNVKLNQIELESIRAKVIRTLPDTTFNFNYILDAFMSKDEKVDTTSSSDPFDISLKRVKLNNVRITYNDAIIGTDADLYLKDLSTEFKEFNIAKSQYHFANIKGDGGAAKLRLYKSVKPSPVAPPTTVPPEVAAADTLDLNVGTVNLANFDWQLESEEDGMRNSVKLGKLELEGDKIYLNGQKIIFKKIALENTEAFVEMANKPEPAPTKKTQTQPAKKPEENNTDTGPGWTAILGNVEVNKVRLKYDDKYAPRQTKGLDYGHLDVSNLAIVLKNFTYSPDRIAGQLAKGTFTEQSGLNLQSLTTNFTYSNKEIGLRNLFLKTPQTVIRDEMVMQYDTIADLSNNLGNVRVKVNIKQSQVAMKDVLLLVPDLAKNPTFKNNQNDIIKADGIITGKVNNLSVPKLSITGFGATRVLAKGNITGLPDPNKLGFNLDITEVSTTKQDIIKLAGADAIPESIELPEKIALRGKLRGKADDLQVDASLESDLGSAVFTGKLQNFVKGQNQAYDGKLTLEEFDAGKLIKQPENVGKLTLEVNAKGTGIDPKTMNASIDGTAKKAVLKGYEYNNLILKGDINNQIANINASLDDPNADFNLLAKADLSKEFPGVEGNVSINNIDLKKLNLYAEDLKIKGDIKLDMASTDPKNPSGTVSINKAVIEMGGKVIPIDTTNLQIQNLPEGRNIVLKSPIVNAEVGGTFDFERVLDMVLTEVNKYFKIPDVPYTPVTEGYDIHINAKVNQHPIIQSFVPELTKLETISFVAEIDNRKDTTMQATVIVPLVEYDSSSVRNANLKLYATGNKATYSGAISQINVSDFSIKRTSLNGEIADNALTTKVVLKDSLNKDQYALAARLKSEEGKYRMNLSSRGTLIDYKEWRSDSTGYIEYGPQGLLVKQFLLEQNGQKLLVNSATNEPNSPIDVKIDSLNIKPFVTIATLDSTLAGGTLNGNLKISNYMTSPVFTGDLVINNLTVTQIPVGNLALNANNETADVIAAKVSLTNDKNDIQVHGNYLTKQKEALDLTVDINKLGAETVKAFSFGQIKSADGNLSGKLAIKGEPTKPKVSGELKFDDVALSLTQLGSKYLFNNQVLTFNDSDLRFNNFVIADTLGQKLTVNGNLNLQNIPEFNYKLQVNAANFMALNGSRKDNDFFYGKGFIDANLNITGVGAKPSIDGTVKLKEGSDITVILPDESISETETDGVVEFINMKNPEANAKSDSTELATNFNDVASEMALNIEVDDKSQLSIVIDEVNGDNLKIKGNAQLNTGITPSGEFYLFGLYELTSGQYNLTFQVLKRQFTIEKGSNLLWTGDPMKAQIDITAAYPLTADLTSLNDEARLYGKVPVKVLLKMQGNLSSPDISFDIVLDEALASSDVKNFVENRALFANFKNDPVAMNKEVFSLLILNRFSGQQSSDFFSGTNAEAIARQSVSKLLTDQLNVLAGDLIKGVKLDFNLNSNFQPAQSGTGVRTDLNVGLSKGFLNDRLTVSVGRNFQIENTTGIQKNSTEIFDNIALNYNLTKDGRYMFRAFRKNEFFILDGYVQETGVSFALTINYETFKELFTKQK